MNKACQDNIFKNIRISLKPYVYSDGLELPLQSSKDLLCAIWI